MRWRDAAVMGVWSLVTCLGGTLTALAQCVRVPSLQILATALALCGDSLFIPIAGGLTLPFKCETTWSYLSIACFSGMHLAAVFASVVLLLLLITAAVTGACYLLHYSRGR